MYSRGKHILGEALTGTAVLLAILKYAAMSLIPLLVQYIRVKMQKEWGVGKGNKDG